MANEHEGKDVINFQGNAEDDLWETRESKLQHLHFIYLSIFLKGKDIEFDESKYLTLGLTNKEGRFTNLGLLFSDENPIEIKFAKYDRNNDFLFKREYQGSLCLVADQVLKQAEEFNVLSAKVLPRHISRIEKASFPGKSLREAILNCFCHADYEFPSNIKIEFFPTYARISNPGAIYRYSLDEVLAGQQSFRNPGIVRILLMLGFIENYGTGLRKIMEAYGNSERKPELKDMDHCFIVILPDLNTVAGDDTQSSTDDTQNDTQSSTDDTQNDTQKRSILELIEAEIRADPYITRDQLAIKLSKSKSTIVRALRSSDRIRFVGSSKSGHWEIAEKKE